MRPLELDTTIAIPKEVHDQRMWDHRKMTDGEVIAKSCRHLGKSHHASCCCCWHCCCWRWTALLLYCCGRTGRRGSFCDLEIIVKWAQYFVSFYNLIPDFISFHKLPNFCSILCNLSSVSCLRINTKLNIDNPSLHALILSIRAN